VYFEPFVSYPISSGSFDVAVADFDGDGTLDLATSNYYTDDVSILLGNGDGTFQNAVNYAAGGGNPMNLEVGYFNADAAPDLAVVNRNGGSGFVSILLGNGDGTFQGAVTYPIGSFPWEMAVDDLNADSYADVAAVNTTDDSVSVLLGNGDGTFQAAVDYPASGNSYAVAVGDYNADGTRDLAVANHYGPLSILLGNGDGTFQAEVTYPAGDWCHRVTAGRFNADGTLDLVVNNLWSNAISILLGNGDGTFLSPVSYPLDYPPVGHTLVDFNGDGTLDIAVTGYQTSVFSILLGNGDGTFQAPVDYCVGIFPYGITSGDFNGDGMADVVTAHESAIVSVRLSTSVVSPPCDSHAPLAHAGSDQSVYETETVILDGSLSSDPDSDPLTYTWTQLGGPDVGALDTLDPVHPTFVAPTVPSGGATLTFELVVNDGSADSEADTVDITIKNVNHPPVADAGSDQAVAEESPVLLDGSASYDVDDDLITFTWLQVGGPMVDLHDADTPYPTFTAPLVSFGGEVLTFEVTVSDGEASDTNFVDVVVENINHGPTADAGTDQTRNEGALVTLDGTASSDPDGDWLMYAWTQTGGPVVTLSGAAGPTPTFTAPLVGSPGTLLYFQLVVDDGYGGVDDDEVVISIQDLNSPPACGLARPDRPMLWPPNHKLVRVNIVGVTDPENDHITVTVTGVTQDEPLDGLGDGDTAPDAVIQGSAVLLRAERAGGGNGRVYRVHFSADDGAGGTCTGSVTVCVPHDQGRGAECVDDGQIYNSLGT